MDTADAAAAAALAPLLQLAGLRMQHPVRRGPAILAPWCSRNRMGTLPTKWFPTGAAWASVPRAPATGK